MLAAPFVLLGLLAIVVLSSARGSRKETIWPIRGGQREVPRSGTSSFGASRDGGARLHAGVDLGAPAGAAILAIEAGVIRSFPAGYVGLDAVAVQGEHGILYGEFARDPKLRVGDRVETGQVLGAARSSAYGSMLHVELWEPFALPSSFTIWKPGQKLKGLIDPTSFLAGIS